VLRVAVRLPIAAGRIGDYLADVTALEAAGADSIWLDARTAASSSPLDRDHFDRPGDPLQRHRARIEADHAARQQAGGREGGEDLVGSGQGGDPRGLVDTASPVTAADASRDRGVDAFKRAVYPVGGTSRSTSPAVLNVVYRVPSTVLTRVS